MVNEKYISIEGRYAIMSKYIFLFRRKEDDRDCCAYIEKQPRFECNHYFGRLILHGANYCNSDFPEYEDVETILTEDEYYALLRYDVEINKLGFGIKKGDERYKKGIKLYSEVKNIFGKLESKEAGEFEDEIMENEKEYMMQEYSLSEEDMEQIFDNYYLDYRDRGILGYIFEDAYECGYEEATSLGYVSDNDLIASRYFDFEKFGQDLADEDENYIELNDGRIAMLCY